MVAASVDVCAGCQAIAEGAGKQLRGVARSRACGVFTASQVGSVARMEVASEGPCGLSPGLWIVSCWLGGAQRVWGRDIMQSNCTCPNEHSGDGVENTGWRAGISKAILEPNVGPFCNSNRKKIVCLSQICRIFFSL